MFPSIFSDNWFTERFYSTKIARRIPRCVSIFYMNLYLLHNSCSLVESTPDENMGLRIVPNKLGTQLQIQAKILSLKMTERPVVSSKTQIRTLILPFLRPLCDRFVAEWETICVFRMKLPNMCSWA